MKLTVPQIAHPRIAVGGAVVAGIAVGATVGALTSSNSTATKVFEGASLLAACGALGSSAVINESERTKGALALVGIAAMVAFGSSMLASSVASSN
jgi:hypothetical protein